MDRQPDADAVASEPVALTVGRGAVRVRRAIGPSAWCALEVLAATPVDDGEPWIVRSSMRDVAGRLGVAPNTAQRALIACATPVSSPRFKIATAAAGSEGPPTG